MMRQACKASNTKVMHHWCKASKGMTIVVCVCRFARAALFKYPYTDITQGCSVWDITLQSGSSCLATFDLPGTYDLCSMVWSPDSKLLCFLDRAAPNDHRVILRRSWHCTRVCVHDAMTGACLAVIECPPGVHSEKDQVNRLVWHCSGAGMLCLPAKRCMGTLNFVSFAG